jgi:tRNA nucleotidyltransferase (CCA-adding enzyme)
MDTRLAPLFSDDHPLARVRPHLAQPVYAVGGLVRDALLGIAPGNDIDLVVESDALPLAKQLSRGLGGELTVHDRFQTATIALPEGLHVDVITARRESYTRPGALPDVEAGTLSDDLARRDFTINAMAVDVSASATATLIDPFRGSDDLTAGLVRMLREDAFAEDPSRIVRAGRYAARLGFRLEQGTAAAAAAQAPRLDWSSARVAGELERLLDEAVAEAALSCLDDLGAPDLLPRPWSFAAIDAALAQSGAPALAAWPLRLGAGFAARARTDVAVDGWARILASQFAQGPRLAEALGAALTRSQVDRLLASAAPATAVGARVVGASAVDAWWAIDQHLRLVITGDDLLAAGAARGPGIGQGLAAARAALLDDGVTDRAAQLQIAVAAARDEE